MNLAQLIVRKLPSARNSLLCSNTASTTIICKKSTKDDSSSSSSGSSNSEDEELARKKTSSNEAVSRLNTLLQQMVSNNETQNVKLNLAQPTNKRMNKKKAEEPVKKEPVEKQVVNAVKEVAEVFGGNTKQTESELLMKLLNPVDTEAGSTTNLNDIIKGMKIEREPKTAQSKADQVRKILQQINTKEKTSSTKAQRRPRRKPVEVKEKIEPQNIDLFGSEPLGIFTDKSALKESPQLKTWQKLHEKELKLAVTHPPANYFQEMILWTEQGKFWQFPINNEIGLEKEAQVYFADHVFLDEHLEPWCPPRGPVRHFMELVCVGLSKNPYLTVEAKREHIEWYKNYFEDKKKLLQDVGAIEKGSEKPKRIQK